VCDHVSDVKDIKKYYPCARNDNVMWRTDVFHDKSNFFMRFRRSNLKELERPIFPPVEQIASILEQFLSLFPQLDLSTSHEQFATNVFY